MSKKTGLPLIDFFNANRKAKKSEVEKPTGDDLKKRGTDAALSTDVAQVYLERIEAALKSFPIGHRITIESLTGVVGRPPPGKANVVGASMLRLSQRKLIRKTGRMVKPGRKERHANLIPEWEIVRYEPTD